MKKSSNLDNSGGLTPATILDKVYDLHRRSHHFAIKTTQHQIYQMNLAEIKKFDILVVEKALEHYKDIKQEDGKKPHPNYFMAICRRLAKEFETKDINERNIWGKTI